MLRVNWIPTKLTKFVLISVLLLILSSSSDQSEIRQNRNQKIERRRQSRQATGNVSCKPPLVVNFNGDACLLPLNGRCNNSKECPLNAECVKSKCVCADKATPHEDNLSCEFFYTEDLSIDGGGGSGIRKTGLDEPNSARAVPEIFRWNSVKMWTMAFGIIVWSSILL